MKLFKFWAKQFCLNTGLHGYKFIVLPRRILLERVFWALVVTASFIAAVVLLLLSQSSFDENPTTLVTDTIHHPIWNYPFPAVTLCNFNKISKERALKQANLLSNKLNHSTSDIADLFALLSLLYFNHDVNIKETDKLLQLMNLLESNNLDLTKLMRAISPSCRDILTKCKWKGEEKRCDAIFEKIITSEGHCCAFNYFAPKHHLFKGSYSTKAPKKPRHISACGFQTSLEAIVNINHSDYFAAETLAYGIKEPTDYFIFTERKTCNRNNQVDLWNIFVHPSYDYPDWSLQSHLVGMKIMALIGINPTKTYALSDVRAIRAQERRCYFKDEFQLENFKFYSYQNCLTECRMNLLKKLCGCIPIVYVNEHGHLSRPDPMSVSVHKADSKTEYELSMIFAALAKAKLTFNESVHNISLMNAITEEIHFLRTPTAAPSQKRRQTHRVCSLSDLECLQKNKPLVKSSMPGVNITLDNNPYDYVWDTQDYPCNCLPDCEFVDYIFETSQGELSRKFSNNNQRNLYGGLQLINHSVIRIYFNDLVGTRNRRNVSYSWQTYLAFYGGILGLFVGFSFVSLIEFIYFFAFKLLTDALKRVKASKNLKKGSVSVAETLENPMKSTTLRHRELINLANEAPQWFVH